MKNFKDSELTSFLGFFLVVSIMDKQSTIEASLIDAGLNNSKKSPGNTKVMQNNSSSYNFISLSINKASNKVDRNNLKIFNSYGQSCKFYNNFHVCISSHPQ